MSAVQPEARLRRPAMRAVLAVVLGFGASWWLMLWTSVAQLNGLYAYGAPFILGECRAGFVMGEPNSCDGPAIVAFAANLICTAVVLYACGRIGGRVGVLMGALGAIVTTAAFPRTASDGRAYDLVPLWIASMCASVVVAALAGMLTRARTRRASRISS